MERRTSSKSKHSSKISLHYAPAGLAYGLGPEEQPLSTLYDEDSPKKPTRFPRFLPLEEFGDQLLSISGTYLLCQILLSIS